MRVCNDAVQAQQFVLFNRAFVKYAALKHTLILWLLSCKIASFAAATGFVTTLDPAIFLYNLRLPENGISAVTHATAVSLLRASKASSAFDVMTVWRYRNSITDGQT